MFIWGIILLDIVRNLVMRYEVKMYHVAMSTA